MPNLRKTTSSQHNCALHQIGFEIVARLQNGEIPNPRHFAYSRLLREFQRYAPDGYDLTWDDIKEFSAKKNPLQLEAIFGPVLRDFTKNHLEAILIDNVELDDFLYDNYFLQHAKEFETHGRCEVLELQAIFAKGTGKAEWDEQGREISIEAEASYTRERAGFLAPAIVAVTAASFDILSYCFNKDAEGRLQPISREAMRYQMTANPHNADLHLVASHSHYEADVTEDVTAHNDYYNGDFSKAGPYAVYFKNDGTSPDVIKDEIAAVVKDELTTSLDLADPEIVANKWQTIKDNAYLKQANDYLNRVLDADEGTMQHDFEKLFDTFSTVIAAKKDAPIASDASILDEVADEEALEVIGKYNFS